MEARVVVVVFGLSHNGGGDVGRQREEVVGAERERHPRQSVVAVVSTAAALLIFEAVGPVRSKRKKKEGSRKQPNFSPFLFCVMCAFTKKKIPTGFFPQI